MGVKFADLPHADFVPGMIYHGGPDNLVWSDPICKLFPCGNQGGIRKVRDKSKIVRAVVIHMLQNSPDMPDSIDESKRQVVLYGDNRVPGRDIFGNRQRGNQVLHDSFFDAYATPPNRKSVPPFFIFTRSSGAEPRAVLYHGIAAPGAVGAGLSKVLERVRFSDCGENYENYRTTLTLLPNEVVSSEWIRDLKAGNTFSDNCPSTWRQWVAKGFSRE